MRPGQCPTSGSLDKGGQRVVEGGGGGGGGGGESRRKGAQSGIGGLLHSLLRWMKALAFLDWGALEKVCAPFFCSFFFSFLSFCASLLLRSSLRCGLSVVGLGVAERKRTKKKNNNKNNKKRLKVGCPLHPQLNPRGRAKWSTFAQEDVSVRWHAAQMAGQPGVLGVHPQTRHRAVPEHHEAGGGPFQRFSALRRRGGVPPCGLRPHHQDGALAAECLRRACHPREAEQGLQRANPEVQRLRVAP